MLTLLHYVHNFFAVMLDLGAAILPLVLGLFSSSCPLLKISPVLTIATLYGRILQSRLGADQQWWRGHVRTNPKAGRIDRPCCSASAIGRGRWFRCT
jgi:hypothetical protein